MLVFRWEMEKTVWYFNWGCWIITFNI